jgi:AsmA protein
METVVLDGVTVNLIRNKEGMDNWQPISDPSAEQDQTPGATAAGTSLENMQTKPLLIRLLLGISGIDVGGLHLNHVNTRYDNRLTNTIILLRDLQIKTGRLRENIPFPLEADFHLTLDSHSQKTSSSRSGDITMQGNATLFWRERHLLLEDLRLAATLRGKALPKRGLKIDVTTNSSIHLPEQKITVQDFSLTHENATLRGSGMVENFDSPHWSMALKIPECSPQSILKQMQTTRPLVRNEKAFSLLSGNLDIKGGKELVEITDLTMTIDETTLTGTLKIEDLDTPAFVAAIHVNQLDLGRYGATGTKKSVEAESQPTMNDPPLIPVQFLHDLLLQLDLQLDSLKIGGAALSQVQIKLDGKDGVLQLPLTANLYDGSFKLEARIDATGDVPTIQIKPRVNKIKLAPLFQDMTGSESVTGTATLQADLNTSGKHLDDLLQQMNGTMRLEILNGKFMAFPIRKQIEAALAPPQNESQPAPAVSVETTGFSRLSATAVIEDGVLYNDDLRATSEEMEINGAGDIHLVQGQTNFVLKVALPSALFAGYELHLPESGAPIIVPYTISGPFSELTQQANVAQFLHPKTETTPPEALPPPVEATESDPEKLSSPLLPEHVGTEGD